MADVWNNYSEFKDNYRTGEEVADIRQAILDHLHFTQGRSIGLATPVDWYMAVACAVRDHMVADWLRSIGHMRRRDVKVVAYLSAEFLMGPHLANNLVNLGLTEQFRQAVADLGQDLDKLVREEEEPGLGNGGLGRLAACFLDSLATLRVPAAGYGIRYEFGIFDQRIRDGWQVEVTDKWLRFGNPWEICRPEIAYYVKFGGHTEHLQEAGGRLRVRWEPHRVVKGVAYDTPVAGYRSGMTDLLRLWKSEAVESFDFQAFNQGDYYEAVEEKMISETISKVLYPNDEPALGKKLRLSQQHFFVSCALQDMIRIHLLGGGTVRDFAEGFTIQLNDTHPAIAVAELMRLLVDEHGMDWDAAWGVTRAATAYTNHTLLPEALEKWPLPLFAEMLPRHLEIVYEINRRFLDEVRERFPGDGDRVRRLSIIDEQGERYVRMAHLAAVGSHAVNGVAALHTELLKQTVLKDFYELWPERFHNVTNGVTPRRWVVRSNPGLSRLITERLGGDDWVRDTEKLRGLEAFARDRSFQAEWRRVKEGNKRLLASVIRERTGVAVDPASLFDVQVKRIHEYKRQHLNVLHIVSLYNRIKRDPRADVLPRTFLFGGKAAPGYFMAKRIIRLITAVGEVVNADADVAGRLKVVFLPRLQRQERPVDLPGGRSLRADLHGGEGGVGDRQHEVLLQRRPDDRHARRGQRRDPGGGRGGELLPVRPFRGGGAGPQGARLQPDALVRGERGAAGSRRPDRLGGVFVRRPGAVPAAGDAHLLRHDDFLLMADYQSYVDAQERVSAAFRDPERWAEMSIRNVARMGKFSSDRSIREYCRHIWGAGPLGAE
jgi:starch phosphorylase